jgi:hypothetical protein
MPEMVMVNPDEGVEGVGLVGTGAGAGDEELEPPQAAPVIADTAMQRTEVVMRMFPLPAAP